MTGYETDHIFDQGFESRPTRPVCYIISNAILNFENHLQNIEQIPSFVWYSLIRKVEDISPSYRSYLKGSYIQIVNLSYTDAEDARNLGLALKGTSVHILHLSNNGISAEGARDLGVALKDTSIHTLNLSKNEIGDEGARDLGLSLKETPIYTLDLFNNDISQDMQETLKEILPRMKLKF